MGCFRSDAGAFFFFLFYFCLIAENKETFILLLHGKTEKQEKFCRIFIITKVQKYIIRVYF